MPKSLPLPTLLLLISFGTVCAVLFTPALPVITQTFHLTPHIAQLSMTLYLAAGCIVAGRLNTRLTLSQHIYLGFCIASLVILCMLLFFWHSIDAFTLFLLIAILLCGLFILQPCIVTLAVAGNKNPANAAAIMSLVNIGIATGAVPCVQFMTIHALTLPLSLGSIVLGMMGIYWLARSV